MPSTYIDLSNIEVEQKDEVPISGVNNFENNYDVDLYCCTSVNASVNLYVMLHYLETCDIKPSGELVIRT